MAQINAEFAQPVNQEGQPVNLAPQAGESDPRAFQVIAPDFYCGVLHEVKYKTYEAAWKAIKCPDSLSGKWTYAALTPSVELMNADTNGVNSMINRQDVTLGVVFKGKMYRPDGNAESPFFKDGSNLLSAVGMFEVVNGVARVVGDTEWIVKRPIKCRVGTAGYVSGVNINLNPKQLTEAFTVLNGDSVEYTGSDLEELTFQYNLDKGYVDENGEQLEFINTSKEGKELDEPIAVRLRLKNAIVGWYLPSSSDIKNNGWITRNGKVFLTDAYADSYERIVEAQSNARGDDF